MWLKILVKNLLPQEDWFRKSKLEMEKNRRNRNLIFSCTLLLMTCTFTCLFDYIDLYIERLYIFATIHFYCEVLLRIEQCNSIKH